MDQPQLVSRAQAVPRRVMFEGRINRIVDFFGSGAPIAGPQAYLVEQKNYVLRPHFHPTDQFQVLYGAPGALFGRHPIKDVVVHYADAFTAYGPLVSADPPLRYYTLRAEWTDVTAFMPDARALRAGRTGRSLHCEVDPAATGAGAETTLFDDARDGLQVSYLTAGAGAQLSVPEAGPTGQFLFVVAGALESAGASYPTESVGWHPPGSPNWAVRAGSDGAGVIVMRYPLRGDRAAGTSSVDGQRHLARDGHAHA